MNRQQQITHLKELIYESKERICDKILMSIDCYDKLTDKEILKIYFSELQKYISE